MPRGDGTGPMGMGPLTGRGEGFCSGNTIPGYSNPMAYAGFGRGRGYRRMYSCTGMPWGRNSYPAYTRANAPAFDEKTFLNNHVEYLQSELEQLNKRLSELNSKEE